MSLEDKEDYELVQMGGTRKNSAKNSWKGKNEEAHTGIGEESHSIIVPSVSAESQPENCSEGTEQNWEIRERGAI